MEYQEKVVDSAYEHMFTSFNPGGHEKKQFGADEEIGRLPDVT